MTLPAGSRLGPYEVLGALGAGGMGEVYRARDTRLNRDVAIKVLPELLAKDAQALERFEAEARAVATLSHPNILAIFDFGSEGETAYAVTELLEGRTLREQIEAEGALPLRQVLDVGAQVAHGLAAAHERGIVHRDLKPANLFLTRDGRAKILDFGLAKHRQAFDFRSRIAVAPTIGPATEPGTVLGTVGYMAPEQVRGEPADARADLFSLGAVLYELVTGRRAFERETAAETMTAILREEPPEFGAPGGAPPALERVIRHCLEKNPQQRFRAAEDLAFALESLAGGSTSGSAAVTTAEPAASGGRRLGLAVAAAVLLVASAFLAGRRSSSPSSATPPPTFPQSFRQLTETPGVENAPSLSPDGKEVVFVSSANGNLDLQLLRVGGRKARPLTADSPEDDWQPAFSPDGGRIAFRSERGAGGIFVMGSTGESVRRLTDFGYEPNWSPDGREIVVSTSFATYPTDLGSSDGSLWALDVDSGERRRVTEGTNAPQQPRWSPHGHRIAYWTLRRGSGQRDLFTVAADGSEADSGGIDVTDDTALDWSPAWSPDGCFLYFSSDRGGTMNLWRMPIDEVSGRVTGEAQPMTVPSAWSGGVSFAGDGRRFAFASLDWHSTLLKVGFDPRTSTIVGAPQPILESNRPIRDHQLSPDGEWVAITQRGEHEDLAVVRINGDGYLQLTDDPARDRGPAWSPDGRQIVFYSDRDGDYKVWSIRPDGSGLEQLTQEGMQSNFPVWSPDGAQIALSSTSSSKNWGVLDLRSSARPRPMRTMPEIEPGAAFLPFSWSPDGARLAGMVRHGGIVRGVSLFSFADGLYERVFEGQNLKFLWLTWLSDGRRLLLRGERGISLLDTQTRELRPLVSVGGYWIGASLGVTRDDRWITWTETATEGDIWLAEMAGEEP